jgi:hypothetical protein
MTNGRRWRTKEDGAVFYNLYGRNDRQDEVLIGSLLTPAQAFRLKRDTTQYTTVREERIVMCPIW